LNLRLSFEIAFFLFEKAVSSLASPFYFLPSQLDLNRAAAVAQNTNTTNLA